MTGLEPHDCASAAAPLDHRQWLLAELVTVTEQVRNDELTEHGLINTRARLRHPSIVNDATRFGLGERRAELLDQVCRRLHMINGAIEYYRSVGDLIDPAPGDAGVFLDRK